MEIVKVRERLIEVDSLLANYGDQYIDWDKLSLCSRDVYDWLYAVNVSFKNISQPFISATLDGGEICVEWQKDVAKIMISFYGDGKYSYYYRDDLTEKFCEDHDFRVIFFDKQIQPLLEFFCEV